MAEATASATRADAGRGHASSNPVPIPSKDPNPSQSFHTSTNMLSTHSKEISKDQTAVVTIPMDKFEAFEQIVHNKDNLRKKEREEGTRSRDPSQVSLRSVRSSCSETSDAAHGSVGDFKMDLKYEPRTAPRKRQANDGELHQKFHE